MGEAGRDVERGFIHIFFIKTGPLYSGEMRCTIICVQFKSVVMVFQRIIEKS